VLVRSLVHFTAVCHVLGFVIRSVANGSAMRPCERSWLCLGGGFLRPLKISLATLLPPQPAYKPRLDGFSYMPFSPPPRPHPPPPHHPTHTPTHHHHHHHMPHPTPKALVVPPVPTVCG
jgi:hypothetical protein